MIATIELYDVVLAIHIAAVVIAFGGVFAYPVVIPWAKRAHPEALPALHAMQARIGQRVISPGMVVVLICGIYLASKLHAWSEVWVTVPLVILVVLGGLAGAFFGPNEAKLAVLAKDGAPEYDTLAQKVLGVQVFGMVLVLVAIFFMAVKP